MRQSSILPMAGSFVLLLVGALGCGSGTGATEEPTGEAMLEIKAVPSSGVSCIAISVTVGSQTTKKYLGVTANGSTASLSLGQLPLGSATINANAYGLACTDSTVTSATAQPNWVADPVSTKLQSGVVANVELVFHRSNPVTASANFIEGVKSLSVASASNLAVMADGTVRTWGWSGLTGTAVLVPQTVPSVSQVASACVGSDSYCALKTDGTVWCWGKNTYGQLGNGTTTDSATPVKVTGLSNITTIGCGGAYACAASEMTNNATYCWGMNTFGELGNNTTTNSSVPVQISLPPRDSTGYKARRLNLGQSATTCFTSTEGHLLCWGLGRDGQLGNGTTTDSLIQQPVPVTGPIVDAAIGIYHGCAVLADGSTYCWGTNREGELGTGNTTQSNTPVLVSGLTGAAKIAAGGESTCAKTQDGHVACWGRNASGELGNATYTGSTVPVVVSGLSGVTSVGVGTVHACALTENQSVYCWGANDVGQLGTGDYNFSSVPKLVQMQ